MKKILLIATILAVIGVTIWLLLRSRKSGEPSESPTPGNTTGSNNSSGNSNSGINYATDNFPLKRFSLGANVSRLQIHLNGLIENANRTFNAHIGSPPDPLLVVDGAFGSKTQAEVVRFFSVFEVSQELFTSKKM